MREVENWNHALDTIHSVEDSTTPGPSGIKGSAGRRCPTLRNSEGKQVLRARPPVAKLAVPPLRNGWGDMVLGALASGPRPAEGRQTGAGETPALPAAMRLLPQTGAPEGREGLDESGWLC